MPSGLTPNLGLTLPTIAGDAFIWGTELNNDLLLIDSMLGPFAGDFRLVPIDNVNGRVTVIFQSAPNGITVYPFIMDRYFTISKFGLALITPDVGKFAYVGIYSVAGNLIAYGKFPLDVAQNFTVVSSSIIKLSPGPYYVAIASDSTIAQAVGFANSSAIYSILPGGLAANVIGSGAMPATLGVITGPVTLTTPTAVMLS